VSTRIDATGQAIGKRYARTDEIGIPFGITIDFDTVEKNLVTLRECMTMKQVQIPLDEVVSVVKDLTNEFISWEEVCSKYPEYISVE
jgi:glycyl-tRNA synthetase